MMLEGLITGELLAAGDRFVSELSVAVSHMRRSSFSWNLLPQT